MDHFSVLNYQGSKKNLLEFIHSNASSYITPNATILDIFSGTCSVGYSYKRDYCVYANDSEYYAYIISTALLGSYTEDPTVIIKQIEDSYLKNIEGFSPDILRMQKKEEELLKKIDSISQLIEFYNSIPTIWNGKISFALGMHENYELFTTYFSNSYFGLKQSMDIDSIRYAIDKFKLSHLFYPLLTALFFAMKECVFSKDGHMAQPLNLLENKNKLFVVRNKSVFEIFKQKFLNFFCTTSFVNCDKGNKTFNLNFEELITKKEIIDNVGFIYADPPYTDMQYSRYYHLLNIVARYDYPTPTQNSGKYTKGLYTSNRYQSKLSSKSSCLNTFKNLISFSSTYRKNLAISFAYPADITTQKTDRYVMSIDDIKSECLKEFGATNVDIATLDYLHSNNRNSAQKKVIEYLILCKGNRQ